MASLTYDGCWTVISLHAIDSDLGNLERGGVSDRYMVQDDSPSCWWLYSTHLRAADAVPCNTLSQFQQNQSINYWPNHPLEGADRTAVLYCLFVFFIFVFRPFRREDTRTVLITPIRRRSRRGKGCREEAHPSERNVHIVDEHTEGSCVC